MVVLTKSEIKGRFFPPPLLLLPAFSFVQGIGGVVDGDNDNCCCSDYKEMRKAASRRRRRMRR